ncbi:MAG: serine/threonine-protein kinase [Gemmatimonadaceae bacterium]
MNELQERIQAAVGSGYRVERELGGGGMSRVYLATEVALDREVVIKLLAPELTSEVLAARFRREFQVTAQLGQHPHILPVLSTGTNGGLLYFITPYIEGESLRHRLRREGKLPIDDAVRILSELGSALAFAHEKGIVHRDLKPENVLLSDGHAILADFGISSVLSREAPVAGHADALRLTEGGLAIGTPGYMSPEQAAGDAVIDGRSDLYSLAVIGYEMVTGKPPFAGDSPMAVMSAHLNQTPTPVQALRSDVPRALADALGVALRKDPGERYQRADDFCTALAMAYARPHAARPSRRGAWMAGGAVIAALAAAAFFLVSGREAPVRANPNLVAIAPFEALGSDLGVWREGLVDLLANNLDGAGPLRAVPPSIVLRRVPERMDQRGARALAERTRAGIAIYGSLVPSGKDSVQARATIVEIASGRSTDVQWRDESARMDRLADSLSMAILRELGRTRAIGATRLASLGSLSLPALKAYLQGEQAYRRSDWDSASAHYQRSVALDSTFAPALRHLSNAMGWRLTPQLELSHEGYRYAIRAGALNRGLAPRESLLVAADSIFAALQLTGPKPMPGQVTLIRRVTALLDDGIRRFPDDPEMWFKYGDVHYHFTRFAFPSQSTLRTARDAFERAIALDSAFAPAYIHHLELAAQDQDQATMRRSARAYLALGPHDVHGRSVRLVQDLMDGRSRRSPANDSVVANAGPEVLQSAFGMLVPLMDSAETQVFMSRALYDAVQAGRAPAAMAPEARAAYTSTLLMRGHVAQALTVADSSQSLPVLEGALLRAIPPDSASLIFDRWLANATLPKAAGRLSAAAIYWSLSGDGARLERAMQLAANGKLANFPTLLVPGLRALARGDSATAIAALTFADSACAGWCWEARLPLAFLLSARHRDREAAALLDQDVIAWPSLRVLWMLERGRVNERLGVRPKAVDAYLYVANAWRHADPALQPYVAEAQRGIARLNPDPSRR